MSWTDERVETLKRLWTEGMSASQIAKELGGVTRNAVIGKVHRLGLSNRTQNGGKSDENTDGKNNERQETAKVSAHVKSAPTDPSPTPLPVPARKPVGIPGQPLPPQPSANEISPEVLAKVSEVEKTAKKLTLMELTERTCKWPIGDPATTDFWFCGLPVEQGKPYCEAHVGVAFQPMSTRRDRRR